MSLTLDLLDEGKSRANTISAKLEDQECAAGWVDCGLCQVKRTELLQKVLNCNLYLCNLMILNKMKVKAKALQYPLFLI